MRPLVGREVDARYEASRPGDVLHSQADISLARRELGYRPLVDVEEGLRRTLAWYQR
jgi:UDP-glucose 4-epimerase